MLKWRRSMCHCCWCDFTVFHRRQIIPHQEMQWQSRDWYDNWILSWGTSAEKHRIQDEPHARYLDRSQIAAMSFKQCCRLNQFTFRPFQMDCFACCDAYSLLWARVLTLQPCFRASSLKMDFISNPWNCSFSLQRTTNYMCFCKKQSIYILHSLNLLENIRATVSLCPLWFKQLPLRAVPVQWLNLHSIFSALSQQKDISEYISQRILRWSLPYIA